MGTASQHYFQCLLEGTFGRSEPGGHLAEALADQVRRQTQPAVRRQGVRARIRDEPVSAEPDETVAHPRAGLTTGVRSSVGKSTLRHEFRQQASRLEVSELESAGSPHRDQVRVPGDDGEYEVVAAHRDRLDAHRDVVPPFRIPVAPDHTGVICGVDQCPPPPWEERADQILDVGSGPGCRSHLRCRSETGAIALGHPQHEVGEGEVGEELPVGDQGVQPVQIRFG